jgi:uncharacterized delta-60 repeat protein
LLLLTAWAPTFGQVSVLDPSFKVGLGVNDGVDSLVLQADQRILVGGEFTSIGGCSNSFLARLESDGLLDASFNPAGQTDGAVSCLLQQPDRKVLVGGSFGRLLGHTQPALARLLADGALDPTFVCTNQITGYVFALLPQADGSVLLGGNFLGIIGSTNNALFRLGPDGRLDDTFDAGLDMSSVFCLVRQPGGQILVGGALYRTGASNEVPLLRLNADLHWDASFQPYPFGDTGVPGPAVYALLLQPDGKIVMGGYWRRHIVRFTPEGHVDGCFDPGLGLGNTYQPGPVRTLALQPDGRILIGGWFVGVDTAYEQFNLARLLPQSDCDSIRVYLKGGDQTFAAATFPPGRTNYLEQSNDLKTWQTVQTNTSPYIYCWNFSVTDAPRTFFRARQER